MNFDCLFEVKYLKESLQSNIDEVNRCPGKMSSFATTMDYT